MKANPICPKDAIDQYDELSTEDNLDSTSEAVSEVE
jgi:hypothetical protein